MTLMDQLGYSYKMNEHISNLIEELWSGLAHSKSITRLETMSGERDFKKINIR
jgi:hypothetical protein